MIPTAEQQDYRAEVRRLLEREAPHHRTLAVIEDGPGYDQGLWKALCGLGAAGLMIPERYGGAGAGLAEALIVAEELGRCAAPSPYLGTAVYAARLLTAAGDENAMSTYLPRIASGETLVAVPLGEPHALSAHGDEGRRRAERHGEPHGLGTQGGADRRRAERHRLSAHGGEDWRLSGRIELALDGPWADLLLVAAGTTEGTRLFAVDAGAPGVTRLPLASLDPTRRMCRIDLDGAAARPVGDAAAARRALRSATLALTGALTADQLGGAEHCLTMSVAYAKTRVQFGRTIGSYQAIKHRCADMYIRVQSARSVVAHIAETAHHAEAAHHAEVAHGTAGAYEEAVGLAKAYCSEAYVQCSSDAVQIHGGIGFTWEHPAHLYFKRATLSDALLGDARHHRARLAYHAGLRSPSE